MTKIRIIIYSIVLILICITAGLYNYFFTKDLQANSRQFAEVERDSAQQLVSSVLLTVQNHYQEHLQWFLTDNAVIADLLITRDYPALLEKTKPFYHQVVHDPSFHSHIQYIHTDGMVVLSLHSYEKGFLETSFFSMLSDDTNALNKESHGFILNNSGIYYRLIQPIFKNEHWVGTVILIVGIDQFMEEFRKYSNLHSALMFSAEHFENIKLLSEKFEIVGSDYILPIGDSFFLEKKGSINVRQQDDDFEFEGAAEYQIVDAGSLFDSLGRQFCRVIVSLNAVKIQRIQNTGLLRACLFAFILSSAAVLIYSLQRRELRHEHQKYKFLVQEKIDDLTEANTLLHQEIENRKNVQKSLSYAIEEWHNTFDVISSPVIILDNEFIALKGNKAAIRLFGGEKAILGKKSYELLELEMSSFAKYIQDGSTMSLTGNEFEIEHKTLKKILHASCVPITYQNEVAGYVLTTMDKTLQRELETQLIQAQKMEAIATLAGGIAHDFNNILGAILGNADLILYQIPKKIDENELNIPEKQGISMAEIESHLFSIKKAGERAKALVRQILAFSRSTESMLQEIDITPIVKEAIKLLRASLPATIEIHSNVAPDLCYVNADPTQIHQILMNLGTNAAQAMEKVGGILDISLWETVIGQESLKRYHGLRQGKYLVLTVKDTGHGMSKSIQSQIFDPFFSTRGVGKGTGMGLSVIHGIVTAHGGIIDVQSEVGKGSVFTVFIPARERMEDSSQNVMVAMPGGAETILFVDDEEEIVKMRTRMLEYLGYKVISATSGKQALTLIQEGGEQVDIVITDLTMPKMTGIQLAAEIRKIFTEIPVILCSGYSETVVPEEAEKAGVKKFMAKPLEMRALANAIREVINKQE